MHTEINSEYLEAKWTSINTKHIKGYRFQRISAESRLAINVGINHLGDRCLIFELPRDNGMVFFNRERQNLSIFHLAEQDYIVIELLDAFFNDLFTDLIVSLYHRIKNIQDVESCARELISSFTKWSEFFSAQNSSRLSDEAVKGLWGELFILREFLDSVFPIQTDQILKSWMGPYDNSHDFIFPDKNIEVKSREAGLIDISISSEFQLDAEFEKPLELLVLDLIINQDEGQTIGQLVEDIRETVRKELGDVEILLRGLAQKGLHMRNLSQYSQRYLPVSKTIYDCMAEGFPKINRSELSPAIKRVRYSVRTTGLDRFILQQNHY